MLRAFNKRKSQSVIEMMALVVFILTAMLFFQKYMARGIYGRWKGVGESFSSGRLYDPKLSMECGYDRWVGPLTGGNTLSTGLWYNAVCFDKKCIDACVSPVSATKDKCFLCINTTCRSKYKGRDLCNLYNAAFFD
ncbi:MAG: hypothetical protein KBD53_11025 [Candidatus Omnitrophica bacterium]|nr:hypothetical protein [Candidatus Omnitrophota bacterium]